mmetsp:Transcript_11715/g.28153  ORF Transcript_11715/g.28153 Transcript_11715/m.28153 type:complete len:302 (-) Transcript_11715:57-962(-)
MFTLKFISVLALLCKAEAFVPRPLPQELSNKPISMPWTPLAVLIHLQHSVLSSGQTRNRQTLEDSPILYSLMCEFTTIRLFMPRTRMRDFLLSLSSVKEVIMWVIFTPLLFPMVSTLFLPLKSGKILPSFVGTICDFRPLNLSADKSSKVARTKFFTGGLTEAHASKILVAIDCSITPSNFSQYLVTAKALEQPFNAASSEALSLASACFTVTPGRPISCFVLFEPRTRTAATTLNPFSDIIRTSVAPSFVFAPKTATCSDSDLSSMSPRIEGGRGRKGSHSLTAFPSASSVTPPIPMVQE